MNAPSPIPAKIPNIIPLLGSNADGEVLGACRAIGRKLEAAKLDFHDLAAAIHVEGETPTSAKPSQRQENQSAGYRYGDWREAWARNHASRHYTPRQEAEQRRQITFCLRNLDQLGPRERKFVVDISRSNSGLSLAQASWLADIADRLDSDRRRA